MARPQNSPAKYLKKLEIKKLDIILDIALI